MVETKVQQYYHYNMPREEYKTEHFLWDAVATAAITIAPTGDAAYFVDSIRFLVSDDFEMTNTDTITIAIDAYGNIAPQTIVVTATATATDALQELIAIGNPEFYKFVNSTIHTEYHQIVIKFKSPVYLRTSTTPTESITLTYAGTGITAGTMRIAYDAWKIAEEDDSGIFEVV